MQCLLHESAEIVVDIQCFVVRRYVCISCNADVVRVGDFVLIEHQMQVFKDDFFHTDVADVVSREHQDVGDVGWYRDDAEHLFFVIFFGLTLFDFVLFACCRVQACGDVDFFI